MQGGRRPLCLIKMKAFFQMLKRLERTALPFLEYTEKMPYKFKNKKQQLRKCNLLALYQVAFPSSPSDFHIGSQPICNNSVIPRKLPLLFGKNISKQHNCAEVVLRHTLYYLGKKCYSTLGHVGYLFFLYL